MAHGSTNFVNTIRLSELDKTVTLREVLTLLDDVAKDVESYLDALLDHWTDDEGLHRQPFQKDISDELALRMANKAAISLIHLAKDS